MKDRIIKAGQEYDWREVTQGPFGPFGPDELCLRRRTDDGYQRLYVYWVDGKIDEVLLDTNGQDSNIPTTFAAIARTLKEGK